LAWPETIDVHLGRGYFMLRPYKQAVQVHQYPTTLPLGRALSRLSDLLRQTQQRAPKANRPGWLKDRLRVTLSAALCPPIEHPVPAGINSSDELQIIACSAAARQLDCTADTLVCALQPFAPGLAAALPRDLLDCYQRLAHELRFELVSLQPLWSVATACRAARRKSCTGIQLLEPDALTTISQNVTPPFYSARSTDAMDILPAASNNSVQGQLRVELTLEPQKPVPDGPDYWPLHWRQL
jgi:hypothetical protein